MKNNNELSSWMAAFLNDERYANMRFKTMGDGSVFRKRGVCLINVSIR